MTGMREAGWSTAQEAKEAFEDYIELIHKLEDTPNTKMRVALSFYAHISEAAAMYEIPKNMLLIADGQCYNLAPFRRLAKKHQDTGRLILPNSNRILRDIVGHAKELGFHDLCECIKQGFDPDIRNAYAHGDYAVWHGRLHLTNRYGGLPRALNAIEFYKAVNMAAAFFEELWRKQHEAVASYAEPRYIWGRMNDEDPEMPMIIGYEQGRLIIRAGLEVHDRPREATNQSTSAGRP